MRAGRRGRAAEWASRQPSRVFHRHDFRYKGFNVFSDAQLLRYLASVRGGVLVGTRPGLNLAIARYARRSVVRIGQDHMNLARLPAAAARVDRALLPAPGPRDRADAGLGRGVRRPARRPRARGDDAQRRHQPRPAPRRSEREARRGRRPARQAQGLRSAAHGLGAGRARVPRLAPGDLRPGAVGAPAPPLGGRARGGRQRRARRPVAAAAGGDGQGVAVRDDLTARGLPDGPARGDERRPARARLRLPDGAARHRHRRRRRLRRPRRRHRGAGRLAWPS